MAQIIDILLAGAAVISALLMFAALIRAILGPRFTDRIIAVNVINSLVVGELVLLSVWFQEDFLVDVALIYALLSFLTVVVVSRLVILQQGNRKKAGHKKNESGGR